mmetsp:Transcript_14611/g.29246  ORF Transcript_14611/g.29246 Transcript_14611/m.29246 type:complete len:204 (-) Transcript_14611:532-1143(-)
MPPPPGSEPLSVARSDPGTCASLALSSRTLSQTSPAVQAPTNPQRKAPSLRRAPTPLLLPPRERQRPTRSPRASCSQRRRGVGTPPQQVSTGKLPWMHQLSPAPVPAQNILRRQAARSRPREQSLPCACSSALVTEPGQRGRSAGPLRGKVACSPAKSSQSRSWCRTWQRHPALSIAPSSKSVLCSPGCRRLVSLFLQRCKHL